MIFSQVMHLMPWRRFQTCVVRYHGDANTHALSRKMSQMFRSIVIGLRKRQGLSTSEIVRHLEDVYEQAPKECTIRDWLQREGLSEKRGRRW